MPLGNNATRCLLALAFLLQPLAATRVSAANPLECVLDQVHNAKRYLGKKRPEAVQDPCVEEVAAEIDWLEHQVETFGTVVPKQPDVWGEARLTKHRQEVERELAKRLDKFGPTLQGSIRRSDQSFLSAALTLNAAAGGAPGPSPGGGDPNDPTETQVELAAAQARIAEAQVATINAQTAQIQSLLGDPNAAEQTLIVRADQTATSGASPFTFNPTSISIEPTAYNRQLSVYLNALNELRRINEGDDTSDSPGYSLNLVRIPVSLLPGKMTRKGYGAEVTFTVEPQITDDLLPTTMRSLIVNDVVDLHALPVSQVLLNDPAKGEELVRDVVAVSVAAASWMAVYDAWLETLASRDDLSVYYHSVREYVSNRVYQLAAAAADPDKRDLPVIDLPITSALPDLFAGLDLDLRVRVTIANLQALLTRIERGYEKGGSQALYKKYPLSIDVVSIQAGRPPKTLISFEAPVGLATAEQIRDSGATPAPPISVDLGAIEKTLHKILKEYLTKTGYLDLAECLRGMELGELRLALLTALAHAQNRSNLGEAAAQDVANASRSFGEYVAKNPDALFSVAIRVFAPPTAGASDRGAGAAGQGAGTACCDPSDAAGDFYQQFLKLVKAIVEVEALQKQYAANKSQLNDAEKKRKQAEIDDKRGEAFQKVLAIFGYYLISPTEESGAERLPAPTEAVIGESKLASVVKEFANSPYDGEVSGVLDRTVVLDVLSESFGPSASLTLSDRRVQRPLPPSMFWQTVGCDEFLRLLVSANRSTLNLTARNQTVTYLDLRRYLIEETERAYDWLGRDAEQAWTLFGTPELAVAIRSRDFRTINRLRGSFREMARTSNRNTVTAALAWSILVDAALLNQRLIDDMKRVAREKGCSCLYAEGLSFVGPEEIIAPEAQEAFKEYVRCRWPIQVFALDPRAEDQNVADQFSRRRELQLALAAGVARGTVRAQAATRFARRLETDIETISLNRTQIAFSHGSDTFGWRFYPRLQTPDTPGTLGAFYETLAGGPDRDADIRDRALEPGLRECTAVIVMPSFIPHVTFQSRGSWFGLTNPRKKALTLQDAMKISRNFQAVRRGLQCATESCAYRPGDVAHMSRVVDQIERRLPLQHMLTPVPFENTLGGFEMFSTGVTDLAPELYGYYGAPGVVVKTEDVECDNDGVSITSTQCSGTCGGTTIFLVGNRFSVHDTKVIAGGRCVPFTLVSREIMRATIPYDAGTVSDGKTEQKYVDVHVATPYGVTSHLLVKAIDPPKAKKQEDLEKSVTTLTKAVQKLQRDIVPVVAEASAKTPKVELSAIRQASGGMKIDPTMGAADLMVEFVNQTALDLEGELSLALLKGDVYISSRHSLDETIQAPPKNNPKSPKSVTFSVAKLANVVDAAIGDSLKTSDFKEKKLALTAVLFLGPDPKHLRTTRVLGEVPIEITLAEGEIAAVTVGAAAAPLAIASPPASGVSGTATTLRLLPAAAPSRW